MSIDIHRKILRRMGTSVISGGISNISNAKGV
jgi:hypothetical protein